MRRAIIWHGGLAAIIITVVVRPLWADEILPVPSRVFHIDYEVNENAQPLESVQLWFTLDDGLTWQQYGTDEDRQSPITFHAPAEGRYGFYLVVGNAAGVSSPPPSSGTLPQQRALVDFTLPVVQLHPLRQTASLGQRVLQIRWTAIDTHFSPRPVEASYRILPQGDWQPTSHDPLANTGRLDWRIPEALDGSIAVRITVTDEGGHRVTSKPEKVEIVKLVMERDVPEHDAAGAGARENRPSRTGRGPAKTRAAKLFAQGLAFRDVGNYRQGVAKLRRAVGLDPQLTDAFVELGTMLYRLRDFDRALGAYQIAMRQNPRLRAARQGAARVFRHKNDYTSAAAQLRTVLRYNPNDAEIWMNLGDIAVYQGDEILARESYTRASTIDAQATDVIREARKRLTLMSQTSRGYP